MSKDRQDTRCDYCDVLPYLTFMWDVIWMDLVRGWRQKRLISDRLGTYLGTYLSSARNCKVTGLHGAVSTRKKHQSGRTPPTLEAPTQWRAW